MNATYKNNSFGSTLLGLFLMVAFVATLSFGFVPTAHAQDYGGSTYDDGGGYYGGSTYDYGSGGGYDYGYNGGCCDYSSYGGSTYDYDTSYYGGSTYDTPTSYSNYGGSTYDDLPTYTYGGSTYDNVPTYTYGGSTYDSGYTYTPDVYSSGSSYSSGFGLSSGYSYPSYGYGGYGYSYPSYSYGGGGGYSNVNYTNTTNTCVGTGNCNNVNTTITNPSPTVSYTSPTYSYSYPSYTYSNPSYSYSQPQYQPPVIISSTGSTNPYISLSSIPYTGLELGFWGTIFYWGFVILWCLFAAYLIVVKRVQNKFMAFLFGEKEAVAIRHEVQMPKQNFSAVSQNRSESFAQALAPASAKFAKSGDAIDSFIMSQIQNRAQA